MKIPKQFNEMSVLFPLLTLYTLAYLALMGYDFAAKESFEIPPGLMVIYITLVLAYSTDREIRRWIGKEIPLRKRGRTRITFSARISDGVPRECDIPYLSFRP